MKFMVLAILAAALFVSAPASAQDDMCAGVAKLADVIMHGRQLGVPMSDKIRMLDDMKDLSPSGRALGREIVIDAYDSPRYTSVAAMRRAVTEFETKWMIRCYRDWEPLQ